MFRSINAFDFDILYSEPTAVEWGVIYGVVPDAPHGPFALDWETQITFLPMSPDFEIEPITDEELWNGGNPCIIGGEVLQFRDCVENEDGTWTISNLLRGRRGSEASCPRHVAGEAIVIPEPDTIELQGETLDATGAIRQFKAVGAGRSLTETQTDQITYYPRDLMPYAPVNVQRFFESSGDLTITWDRRNRLGGNMADGTGEVPMSENSESYEIYILTSEFENDPTTNVRPTNAMRVYTSTTPIVYYTDADMTEDGFNPFGDTLHVVVYQISAACGRGFPGYRTIEAWRDS
jgi:hypothetical protein